MSFPGAGLFGQIALSDISSGLIKPKRGFGGLVADVTVDERHNDTLTITQQPVEKTAAITDHAYKEPPRVIIHCAWSSSVIASAISNALSGNLFGALSSVEQLAGGLANTRPTSVYQQLLQMQETVELLTVYTGKRKYDDMLLAEIEVITNQDSEYALVATLTFQHVNLVEATTVTVPSNDVQASPQDTGSLFDRGSQNLLVPGQPPPLPTFQ